VHRANVIQRKGLLVQLKAPHALKPFVRQHLDRFELVPQANPTEAPITRTIDERPECHYPTAAPTQSASCIQRRLPRATEDFDIDNPYPRKLPAYYMEGA
jgi:hypothetical protein